MITFVISMRVLPENVPAYEAAFVAMQEKVLANEPGTIHYALSKSAEDPTQYVAIEVYRDEAALEAHASAEYFRASRGKTAPLMLDVDYKRYEGIEGRPLSSLG